MSLSEYLPVVTGSGNAARLWDINCVNTPTNIITVTNSLTPTPMLTPTPGVDFNGDGKVDPYDLVQFFQAIRDATSTLGDYNHDRVCNWKDLLLFLPHWQP